MIALTEHAITPDAISPEVKEARIRVNSYSETRLQELLESTHRQADLADQTTALYGLIENGEELNTDKLIVVPHPFANGHAMHMLLRGMMLQKALPQAHPVLLLPNPSFTYAPYSFSEDGDDEARLGNGDFTPLTDKQEQIIEQITRKYKSETTMLIDGYSQGAAVGAQLMGRVSTFAALLAEAPNVAQRTENVAKDEEEKALDAAFKKGGIAPLNRAVMDTNLESLERAQGVISVNRPGIKQAIGLSKFGIGTLRSENKLLKQAMSVPNFIAHVQKSREQQPGMQLHLARAIGSLILPYEAQEEAYFSLYNAVDKFVTLDSSKNQRPYGHAAGDNLLLHAEAFKQLYNDAVAL